MNNIKNLSEIDTNLIEGRYLLAALAKLTTEIHTDKEPDDVLNMCGTLQRAMFGDSIDPPKVEDVTFGRELEQIINKHSMENGSNTPDYILCNYILMCLRAFDTTTKLRDHWYGVTLEPGVNLSPNKHGVKSLDNPEKKD